MMEPRERKGQGSVTFSNLSPEGRASTETSAIDHTLNCPRMTSRRPSESHRKSEPRPQHPKARAVVGDTEVDETDPKVETQVEHQGGQDPPADTAAGPVAAHEDRTGHADQADPEAAGPEAEGLEVDHQGTPRDHHGAKDMDGRTQKVRTWERLHLESRIAVHMH